MANDKNKLDDFKLDDGLDFEFDGQRPRDVKDDRNAIRRISTSFAQGAAETLTSPSTIKRLALSALPRGYATAINTADEALTGASELYNIAAKEIKPAIPAMRRATQKALPKVRSYLPKGLSDRLQKFADHKEDTYRRRTQEDFDNEEIAATLGEMTRTQLEFQAEAQARSEVRTALRERVEDHQRHAQLRTLESIQSGIGRLVGYQDSITNQYQRKSLELQYRQYFVQRDTLRFLMDRGAQQVEWEKAMLHNSALPDQAKLKLSEAAHASFRDRLLGGMQLQVANFMGNYTKKLKENLARSVKSAASSFSTAFQQGDDLQQQIADARAAGFGESEDDVAQYSKMAGGGIADAFATWLAGKARTKLDARSKPGGMGERIQYMFRSIPERLNRYAQSPTDDLSIFGFLQDFLKDSMPRFYLDSRMGVGGLSEGDKPATFDNLTRRSIIEVIPGYLSRIHQELAVANNGGQPVDRLVFNFDRGRFDSSKKVASDIKRKMFDPASVYGARQDLDKFVAMLDKDGKIAEDPELRKALIRQIVADTAAGLPFDIKRYTDPEAGENTSELSADKKIQLSTILEGRFKQADGSKNFRELNDVISQFSSLRNRIPDAKQMATVYNEAGYGDILEEMGLIRRGLGGSRYNYDKAWTELLTDAESSESLFAKRRAEEEAKAHSRFDKAFAGVQKKASEVVGSAGSYFSNLAANTNIGGWMTEMGQKLGQTDLGVKATNLGTAAMQAAQSMGQAAAETVGEIKDIYVGGRAEPVIQAIKMRAGEYFDQLTGNPVNSLQDIQGPVVNSAGEVVLSTSDIANNLMDHTGRVRSDISDAVRANVEKLASVNLSANRAVGVQGAASTGTASAAADITATPDYSELVNLNSQQVELLKVMVTILSTQGAAQGTGPAPGKIRGFLDNMVIGGAKRTWGGIKLFGSAYAAYIRGIGKGIGGLIGGAGKAFGSATSLVFNKLKSPLESYRDIYVNGEKDPALTAAKMRRGHYQNSTTGKTIKGFKDIGNGPIIDVSDNGNVVLTEEQIRSGIYVKSPNGLVRVGLASMSAFAKTVVSGYFNLAKLPFAAVSAAAKGLVQASKMMFNDVVDIYVDTDLKTPRLRAMLIKNGRYYNAKDGTVITGFKSIKGAVKQLADGSDRASPTDIEVLSLEESARICDSRGNPLRTGAQKALGIAGGLLSGAGRLASWTVKGYASLVGGAIRGLGAIGGGVANGFGRFLSAFLPQGDWLDKFTRSKDDSPTKVLKDIYTLLQERLPKPTTVRENSWQDQNAERAARKAAQEREEEDDRDADREQAEQEKFMSGMFGKLGGIFSSGMEGLEGGGDGGTTILGNPFGGGDGGEGRGNERDARGRQRGGWRRNARARWERMKRTLGRTRAGRAIGGASWGNRTGAGGMGGGGGVGRGGGMLGKLRGLGGGLGGLISSLAMMAGGSFLIDKLFGEGSTAANVANTAVDVGSTGLGLYSLAGMAGGGAATTAATTAATAGTAATAATAATAGATAAGTAGAASAAGAGLAGAGLGGALLTVGLPVAIVGAAIGYAGYKAFKKYKYGTYVPLRSYRMAQYGVQYNNASQVEKLVDLEQMLEPHVVPTGGGFDIRSNEISMDTVYEMFDLDDGWFTSNAEERKAFDAWFNNRFKPIFLSWKANLRNVSNRTALNDADDELDKEQKKGLLRSVRNLPANYFNVTVGPFDGEELDIQAGDLENEYLKAMQEIEEGGGAMSTVKRLASAAAQLSPVAFLTSSMTDWSERMQRDRDAEALKNDPERMANVVGTSAVAAGAATVGAAATVAITGQPNPETPVTQRALDALRVIRMRAYGLSDLDGSLVRALSSLETEAAKLITVEGNGAAKFDGNPEAFFNDFCGLFGVPSGDRTAKTTWINWFQRRFIPTLLAYCGKVFSFKKGGNVFAVEAGLTPDQRYEVGNAVANASYYFGGIPTSVWSYNASPWGGAPLNEDPHSVYSNLEALKEARGKAAVVREQTSRAAGGQGDGTAKNASKQGQNAAKSSDPTIRERLSGMMGGAMNAFRAARTAVAAGLSSAWNSARNFATGIVSGGNSLLRTAGTALATGTVAASNYAGGAVGQAAGAFNEAIGGLVGQIPLPNGDGSWQAVRETITAAAKMAGVPLPLMATMANIESGFRTGVKASTSSATGLYQFIRSTWNEMLSRHGAKYGIPPGTPPTDPRANALMGAEFLKENAAILRRVTGREPTDTELYLAHFMGPGGASKLLRALGSNPDTNAVQLFPEAAQANRPIFYENGQPRSVAGVMMELERRVRTRRVPELSGPNSVAVTSAPPATGGITTTTANGPTGGIGPATGAMPVTSTPAASASPMVPVSNRTLPTAALTAPMATAAAVSGLPQTSTISPTEISEFELQRQRQMLGRNAVATDFRGSEFNAEVGRQMSAVTEVLQQQLTVQKAMASKMAELTEIAKKIDSNTAGGFAGGQPKELTANNSAPGSARGARPTQSLPSAAPVSMQRSTA